MKAHAYPMYAAMFAETFRPIVAGETQVSGFALMHIVSLNIGRPQLITRDGRTFSSSINRRPVHESVNLTLEGFVGDRPSNQEVHGGVDKAVCCYPHEHYAHWREVLGGAVDVPAFGENLTTMGALETEVCVGDVFRIGGATVQVSQPRQPCGTLAMRNNCSMLPKWVNEAGYTGFYVRVVELGEVRAGDAVMLIERPRFGVTILSLTRLMLDKEAPVEKLEAAASIVELSQSWRTKLTARARILRGEAVEDGS